MAILANFPAYIYRSGKQNQEDVLFNLSRISKTSGTSDCHFDYDEGGIIRRWHVNVTRALVDIAISRSDDMNIFVNTILRNNKASSGTLNLTTSNVIYGYPSGLNSHLLIYERNIRVRYLVAHDLDQIMMLSVDASTIAGRCYIKGDYIYFVQSVTGFTTGDNRRSWNNDGVLTEAYDGTNWIVTEQNL
jgi:hypothetical protein